MARRTARYLLPQSQPTLSPSDASLEDVVGARSTTLLECGPLGNRLRKMVLDFDVPRSELPPDATQPDALHKEVVQFARYLQPPSGSPPWLLPLAPL